jgi:hypothetical protein
MREHQDLIASETLAVELELVDGHGGNVEVGSRIDSRWRGEGVTDFRAEADAIFASLLARIGEAPRSRASRNTDGRRIPRQPRADVSRCPVTGTNGKTSTARMIESLLRAHGIRVGLLTSPHLRARQRTNHDRWRTDQRRKVRRELARHRVLPRDGRHRPLRTREEPLTYFEALTFSRSRRSPMRPLTLPCSKSEWVERGIQPTLPTPMLRSSPR